MTEEDEVESEFLPWSKVKEWNKARARCPWNCPVFDKCNPVRRQANGKCKKGITSTQGDKNDK